MKLNDTIKILASIGDDAKQILHKKVGKHKGLSAIEDQIRDEATKSAEGSFGGSLDKVARTHIDRYVSKRMKFMKKAFSKLDNPKTDTSKERADFIGDTETKFAKNFGKTKGFERREKINREGISKQWVTNGDACPTCLDNEDDGPIPVDEEFSSGDYAPGAHPGCNCTLEYTNEDGDELD